MIICKERLRAVIFCNPTEEKKKKKKKKKKRKEKKRKRKRKRKKKKELNKKISCLTRMMLMRLLFVNGHKLVK